MVPVELTDQSPGVAALPDRVSINEGVAAGAHIRRAASDLAAGDPVLRAGELLSPAALGSAASVGHGVVEVVSQPRVAVVATGAELVDRVPRSPTGRSRTPTR